jgi:hypothetical protein
MDMTLSNPEQMAWWLETNAASHSNNAIIAAELRRLQSRVNALDAANKEWHDKTAWVRNTEWIGKHLGRHIADAMNARITSLEADAQAWRTYQARKQAVIKAGMGRNPMRTGVYSDMASDGGMDPRDKPVGMVLECVPKGGYIENPDGSSSYHDVAHWNSTVTSKNEIKAGELLYPVVDRKKPDDSEGGLP